MSLELPPGNQTRRLPLVDQHGVKEIASGHARQRARCSPRVGRRLPQVHSLDPMLGESTQAVIQKIDGHLVHVPDEVRIAMGSTKTWTSPHHNG